jgi:hypothetical protein
VKTILLAVGETDGTTAGGKRRFHSLLPVAATATSSLRYNRAELLTYPTKAVERMAREQHGWPPRVLFKARQGMRVKAIRCGFGPGGYWSWKLPDHMTDKDVHFHPGEWRSFIAGHRDRPSAAG